jgi:hypothetical protein
MKPSDFDARPIPGFPLYHATRDGLILGQRGRPMAGKLDTDGYLCVTLKAPGVRRCKCIHQWVARAWLGPKPTPAHQVAHNDGDRLNNAVSNLRWATPKENNHDMDRHGTRVIGEAHFRARFTADDIATIRQRLKAGEARSGIAREFGVGYWAIAKIATGKRWKHAGGCA